MYRGQHPHAKIGGSYNPVTRTFVEGAGPETWASKSEADRARWEERHVNLPDGRRNPFAQYDVKDQQASAALKRVNRADTAIAQMSELQRNQLDKDGDGTFSAAELAAHGLSVGADTVSIKNTKAGANRASRNNDIIRAAGDGVWTGRGAFSRNTGSPAMLASLPPSGARADLSQELTQATVPAAGMSNYIKYNAFAIRRPDLFSGAGAESATTMATWEPVEPGVLPRSRDKSSITSEAQPSKPPPKHGFGIATEQQKASRIAELGPKPVSGMNQTIMMHPVLGPVVVQNADSAAARNRLQAAGSRPW